MNRTRAERVGGDPPPVLEWAARLYARGVNVIPVGRDKRPKIKWKRWQSEFQGDIPYPADERYLAENFVAGVNLAAVTGAVSGIVVADADSLTAWTALLSACGESLARSVVSVTGKGRHVWFAHPGHAVSNTVRLGGVALDIRGDGGYVVCPPSKHPNGRAYTWIRSPLDVWPPAEMPAELLAQLEPPRQPPPESRRSEGTTDGRARYPAAALEGEVAAVSAAPVSTRNDTLNRAAFALARFVLTGALSAVEIFDALMDAARVAGLGEAEAQATIESAFASRCA